MGKEHNPCLATAWSEKSGHTKFTLHNSHRRTCAGSMGRCYMITQASKKKRGGEGRMILVKNTSAHTTKQMCAPGKKKRVFKWWKAQNMYSLCFQQTCGSIFCSTENKQQEPHTANGEAASVGHGKGPLNTHLLLALKENTSRYSTNLVLHGEGWRAYFLFNSALFW